LAFAREPHSKGASALAIVKSVIAVATVTTTRVITRWLEHVWWTSEGRFVETLPPEDWIENKSQNAGRDWRFCVPPFDRCVGDTLWRSPGPVRRHGAPMTLDNVSQATAPALHHWAIDRRVSDPLSNWWAEDFVIHDLSGAPLPDRWCDDHLLKLQA
jgi:hypothetical protein